MDEQGELLLDISLESVVQKAEELESVLRSTKSYACRAADANEEVFEHVPLKGEGLHATRNGLSCPSPIMSSVTHNHHHEQTSPADMAQYWRSLTSYIVSLEKELHYYKLLVEDSHQLLAQRSDSNEKQEYVPSSYKPAATSGSTVLNDVASSSKLLASKQVNGKDDPSKRTNDMDQYWRKLTEDDPESRVLLLVFSFLSTAELCQVSCVCHKWYTISKHPLLWRRIIIEESVVTPQVLSTLSQWCHQTEILNLHGLMPAMASCDEDLQTYIARTRGCLEPALTRILATSTHTLSSLTISECNLMITDHMMWTVSMHCPHLKVFSYCSDEFPPSSEALWSLAIGCPQLQHLHLPPVLGSPNASWFNDSSLLTIAHNWSNLLSLTIGGKHITSTGLAEISLYCRELQYLEVIHGPDFDKDTIEHLCKDGSLTSLNSLILNFTPSSRIALENLIDHCPNLTSLHLHITLSLYFPDSTESNEIATYGRIVSKFRSLEKSSQGKNIFHLYEHYYGSQSPR